VFYGKAQLVPSKMYRAIDTKLPLTDKRMAVRVKKADVELK